MGKKMMIDDIVMGAISFSILLLFIYVTYKVARLIKCGDKILLLMLLSLDVTLISIVTLHLYNLLFL